MRTVSEMPAIRIPAEFQGTSGGYLVETLALAESTDPFVLLEPSPTGFQAWWHHAGDTLVGTGIAIELRARGADRFHDIARQLSELPSSLLAFTGGAFRPGPEAEAERTEFPDAAAWVPEVLVLADDHSTTLIAVGASGEVSREELRARLDRAASRLRAIPRMPAARGIPASPPLAATPAATAVPTSRAPQPILAPDDDAFDGAVEIATDRIGRGALSKVVLARMVSCDLRAPLPAGELANALRTRFPSAFVFGIQHGTTSFAGASPELLVQVDGRAVTSTPAAGTAPASAPLVVLHSEKNLREQGLVAEAVAGALAAFCDELDVSEPQMLDAGPVRHLVTNVRGRLTSRTHAMDLVQALHPTPAVCGTPVRAALETIAEVEGFDRGWYAGPIGIVSPTGDGTLAIALRALLADGTHIERFAGAGIVAGSEAAAERREIDHKLSAMGDLLDTLD